MDQRDPNQITVWSSKIGLCGIPIVIGLTLIDIAKTGHHWEPVTTGVGIVLCFAGLAALVRFWRTL